MKRFFIIYLTLLSYMFAWDGECYDVDACNYNPSADYNENNDKTCLYTQHFCGNIHNTGVWSLFVFEDTITSLDIGDEIAIYDYAAITNFQDCTSEIGEMLVGAGVWTGDQLNISAVGSVDLCSFGSIQLPGYKIGNQVIIKIWDQSENQEHIIETDLTFNELPFVISDLEFSVSGCTDNSACNFNSEADLDDGSCQYPSLNLDCDGNCLVGVDECGNCGGSGIPAGFCNCDGDVVDECGECGGNGSSCTNEPNYYQPNIPETQFDQSITFDSSVNLNNGAEIGIFDLNGVLNSGPCEHNYGELLVGSGFWNGNEITINAIGSTEMYCNQGGQPAGFNEGNQIVIRVYEGFEEYDTYVETSDNLVFGSHDIVINQLYLGSPGCTDEAACNYDSDAEVDDGSCDYSHFCFEEWNDGAGTGINHLVVFTDSISGIEEGFEIGVFDLNGLDSYADDCSDATYGEILVGAGVWDNQSNDEGTVIFISSQGSVCENGGPAIPGYVEGNDIVVRVWDPSGMVEYETSLSFSEGDGSFDGSGSNTSAIDSILFSLDGCTDDSACNYNEFATDDDDSCFYCYLDDCATYPIEKFDCEGNCIVGIDCFDVCGGTAEFDECGVCDGDGIADDECDCNGNVEDCNGECGGDAIEDDCGVCEGDGSSCEVYIESSVETTVDDSVLENLDQFIEEFELFMETQLGLPNGSVQVTSVTTVNESRDDVDVIIDYTITLTEDELADTEFEGEEDIVDNLDEIEDDIEDEGLPEFVYGCVDPDADNYDAEATIDDGSCIYDIFGCTDQIACNYNSEATADDDSCIYPVLYFVDLDGDGLGAGQASSECSDPGEGYVSNDLDDFPECSSNIVDACGVCDGDSSSCTGCQDECADNYDESAIISGECIYTSILPDPLSPLMDTGNPTEWFVVTDSNINSQGIDFEWGEGGYLSGCDFSSNNNAEYTFLLGKITTNSADADTTIGNLNIKIVQNQIISGTSISYPYTELNIETGVPAQVYGWVSYTSSSTADGSGNPDNVTLPTQNDINQFIVNASGYLSIDNEYIPTSYSLHQNYPNPFNPETRITVELPFPENISLTIFDMQGKLIKEVTNSFFNAGSYDFIWDGKDYSGVDMPSGLYIYKLESNNIFLSKKMLLLR